VSRVPLPYTQKVLDLFRNPKNLGKLEDANVISVAGNPACGDMITFYMKINEQDIIEKISFESYGCAANIATASIVTELIKGLSLERAWKDVTWKKVTEEVGGLPIRKYYEQKGSAPSWLPKELTFEEKQAIEEEELAKKLSKKLKAAEEK
jgi:nitrogen fixation NifU-like protein